MRNSDDRTNGGGLPVDAVFELLGHPYRREMLRELRSAGGETTRDRLVERIRAFERRRRGTAPSPDRLARELHHVHAPKLQSAGLIAVSADGVTYRYRPDETVDHWLDFIDSEHGNEV